MLGIISHVITVISSLITYENVTLQAKVDDSLLIQWLVSYYDLLKASNI